MDIFNLEANEVVILRARNVMHGEKLMSSYSDELVLTNKAIIHIVKGMLGNVKEVRRYRLAELKTQEGFSCVRVGKNKNGTNRLELYFKHGQEYFTFQTISRIESMKWVRQINLAIGKNDRLDGNTDSSIGSVVAAAETLKDTMDSVLNVFGVNKSGVVSCKGCGADVVGKKNALIRCEYCGKINRII